jgi:hypothetical protein
VDIRSEVFREICSAMSGFQRITFEVPDFYDLEADRALDFSSMLKRAVQIRSDPKAEQLRRQISALIRQAQRVGDNRRAIDSAREAVRDAAAELVAKMRPSRKQYFREFAVSALLTTPATLLIYESSILSTIAGIASGLLVTEIKRRLNERKHGWFYLVFDNGPFTRLSLLREDPPTIWGHDSVPDRSSID